MTERFARVALPLPLAEPYRYRIPASLNDRTVPGARVVVPVRRQEWVGVVAEVDVDPPAMVARDILAVPDVEAAVTPPLLTLAQTVSRYYGAPIGMVLKSMLPAALWGHSVFTVRLIDAMQVGGTAQQVIDMLQDRDGTASVTAIARKLHKAPWDVLDRLQRIGAVEVIATPPVTDVQSPLVRVAELCQPVLPLLERDRRFGRAPRQRALYDALENHGGRHPVRELLRGSGGDSSLRVLEAAGLIRLIEIETPRDPFAGPVDSPPAHTLSGDQLSALHALDVAAPGEATLLFGVTASGKTQVYLERIRHALDRGMGAIILVPEISLTPQTVGRVRAMFPDQVAVLHSALSDGERADAWRALRRGQRRIVVGARSAVFAPVERLGVIVVDEEHEPSYKNGETPRYHARDVAAMRARIESAQLILGTATPSAESWARASESRGIVRLPERVGSRPMPPVELVDLRSASQVDDSVHLPWTEVLDEAVQAALQRQDQILLLLNRRGWTAFLQCSECGEVVQCPNCSISLTLHRHPDQLRCHYCDFRVEPPPTTCSVCAGVLQRSGGAGTQQLERLMAERFPTARIARMDLDTTATKWSHHHILGRVEQGKVDILLGTQMIAKGIDFPNVTLVGVVDADVALHLPDFRAAERTFQLVAQVAGRAGRGPRGGRVLVQTRQPDHPALTHAAAHDAEGFLELLLQERRSPAYPPHVELVRLVLSGDDQGAVASRAAQLADWCDRVIARSKAQLLVVGPAPCPIERIKERWRYHLILKGPPTAIGRWIRSAAAPLGAMRDAGVRISVDRDPMQLL